MRETRPLWSVHNRLSIKAPKKSARSMRTTAQRGAFLRFAGWPGMVPAHCREPG
jgi:hypothetical protein